MIGKLCSGSWGGAIFPPDDEIAIEGAIKIKPNFMWKLLSDIFNMLRTIGTSL
jgi:hypothetical protein